MFVDVDRHGPFRLDPGFLEGYRRRPVAWGFGPLSRVTYQRSYSRDGEAWWQTCRRVVEGMFTVQRIHCRERLLPWDEGKAQGMAQDAYERLFTFKWTPPGRGLWIMGTRFMYEHGGAALNNCGFISTRELPADFTGAFGWMLRMSMLGVGVGFDTRGAGLVTLQPPARAEDAHVIGDSREGWGEALERVLGAFVGKAALPAAWDFSRIRPSGTPLRSFGGYASGPEPLEEMLAAVEALCQAYVGRPIDSTFIVDAMNLIGRCVVAGGIRRSAQIAFGAPDDAAFLDLKQDREKLAAWRWVSNNSVLAEAGMDYAEVARRTADNGEPGFLWLDNARAYGRMGDPPDWRDRPAEGSNPCVTGDALIFTAEGPRRADQLLDRPFTAVVDGAEHRCATGVFRTGVRPVYRLLTREGHAINVTADHRILTAPKLTAKKRYEMWVEARDLSPGDRVVLNDVRGRAWGGMGSFDEGWLLGSLLGDGHFEADQQTCKLQFWGPHRQELLGLALMRIERLGGPMGRHERRTDGEVEDREMASTGSRRLWALAHEFGISSEKEILTDAVLTASSAFQEGFLRGLFDAGGSVQGTHENGASVRLASVDRQHLAVVQRMLLHLGIHSVVDEERRPAGVRELPDGEGGARLYGCATAHELVVANGNLRVFHERVGFDDPGKRAKLDATLASDRREPDRERFVATIASVVYEGVQPVYDCTVDDVHRFGANGIVVHNCVEQTLWDRELCTLVETFPARHDDFDDFERTLRVAYLYAKTVTLVPTDDLRTNTVMLRNRRIGCSMTGIVQACNKFGYRRFMRGCDRAYRHVQALDEKYSNWLCIPRSIKTTSIKPSGTVSLLAGATPGVHWEHAPYYIRRIRVANQHPLLELCREAGYHTEPDHYSQNTTVIEFPVRVEHLERAKDEVPLREKVDLAAQMQRYWCDNQVSCTAEFDPEREKSELPRILEAYEDRLKAIVFLPNRGHGYVQAPYETITPERYAEIVARLKPIRGDLDHEHEYEARFCDGRACEI